MTRTSPRISPFNHGGRKKKPVMQKLAMGMATAFVAFMPAHGFTLSQTSLVMRPSTLYVKGFNPILPNLGQLASVRTFHMNQPFPNHRQNRLHSCKASIRETNDYGFPTFIAGPIYDGPAGCPTVTLFTKEECTLCDKVKDVLEQVRAERPHALYSVDIADPRNAPWWDKYKYDIPVLHVGGRFWIKHRLSADDAMAGLAEAAAGSFAARQGDPDAKKMERSQPKK
jgi:hypothetical protein